VVAFPEAGDHAAPLGLDMRSRVLAARDPELLRRLGAAFEATSPAAESD
jgi:hypothetical protein